MLTKRHPYVDWRIVCICLLIFESEMWLVDLDLVISVIARNNKKKSSIGLVLWDATLVRFCLRCKFTDWFPHITLKNLGLRET